MGGLVIFPVEFKANFFGSAICLVKFEAFFLVGCQFMGVKVTTFRSNSFAIFGKMWGKFVGNRVATMNFVITLWEIGWQRARIVVNLRDFGSPGF